MKHVLIADDEANIVVSLEFLMRREGHRVSVARDGDAALAAIRAERPDLVLAGLEPRQRETSIAIELALLFGQVLVQRLID